MILRGLVAAVVKDLRLVARDRVGLTFLTLAPMVVMTVAGFSLASLYGADPRGATGYTLPLVDEDGGEIGRAIFRALSGEPSVRVLPVAGRDEAIRRLRRREAGAALVIPAGASLALREGRSPTLVLLTDPVKYLEIANLRGLVQEIRHGVEEEGRRRAAEALGAGRAAAEESRERLARTIDDARQQIERFRLRLGQARLEAEAARRSALADVGNRLAARLAGVEQRRREGAARRLDAELQPVRRFLAELVDRRRAFDEWLGAVRERAGKLSDRIPAPPEPPAIPDELSKLAAASSRELVDRLLAGGEEPLDLPDLPPTRLPPVPDLPAVSLPEVALPPLGTLPGGIELEERSVTGAPRRLNTFDQNVPGFSVTFLLLGMLLGVSLGVLDERDWGTFERLRSMPVPFSVILCAKILSRLAIGMVQMTLLFAVGKAAFGISLGPEPLALVLPTAGIVFAGTAFGLVVAGLARTREAVLPIGSIVIVTMAAVGGCWWPIDLEPEWMRSAAKAFPTTWAMAAYNDLMIRRQGVSAALWPTTVLVLHGVVYSVVGLALFRRRT